VASPETIKTVFAEMQKRFKPNAVDKEMTIYFSLGEGPGEKWTLKIGPQACSVSEGKPEKDADNFLKTTSDLFVDMIKGKYKPGMMDFMKGKIKSKDPLELNRILKEVFGN
jgi:putative sterol carrier protein